MTCAYYNEIDPKAAAWLRELIARDLIAPGDVDERSIADVRPDDLRGYRQCHFFAGIGVWSYALRRAGWADDRPVWTGSCPCQPFSAAGKSEGYADERHLWPHWYRLIGECRPPTLFGEQVDAAIRTGWLDDVCLSLESLGYAVGAVDFPACSVGAPHIRQRIYFVAESECGAAKRHGRELGSAQRGMQGTAREQRLWPNARDGGDTRAVADDDEAGRGEQRQSRLSEDGYAYTGDDADGRGESCGGGDAPSAGRETEWSATEQRGRDADSAGATNGFWRDAEWITCRDGKARPVKPGTFPLAHGTPARVVRLRGYGNAIVAEQAATFIEAYLACQ